MDEEVTPIQRPVRNQANRAAVLVLHNLALTLEATPRALGDLARTIQDAEDELSDLQAERIARVLDEHAAEVSRGAGAFREAKGKR